MSFLPTSMQDMENLNIEQLDFVFVTGDAYVDHPSFGHAIITRVLQSSGYSVGIIAQPDWKDKEAFKILGRPRLGFLVSSGNIDSMVNHYTSSKKKRSNDIYSPDGKSGCRPDRATIVYCNMIRQAYGDIFIAIGGIEASLRRFAHYDYWDNKVRRSILFDSTANILIYGMGERQITQIAERLGKGYKSINDVEGTAYKTAEKPDDAAVTESFEQVRDDKVSYAKACRTQQNIYTKIAQHHIDKWLVVNKSSKPLTQKELDKVYSLPYERTFHPMYNDVPAITEVKFSITSARGCFGGCSFCALHFHQGRKVTSRSHNSVLAEAVKMTYIPDFKGYIHDVGGPTANFREGPCDKSEPCTHKQCLYPKPCANLKIDHKDYLSLLRKLRATDGIKKVFIRSGIRYDYCLADNDSDFLREICEHHISGQLKIAPEHICDNVLSKMGKPSKEVFRRFSDKFYSINEKLGKKQYIVPYLMSSHPGSTIHDAIALAQYLKQNKLNVEQVQDFYPTPGTISTCMYYTGLDPRNMNEVYVPRTYEERKQQRVLLQFLRPSHYNTVKSALIKAGRDDLIGFDSHCLIKPRGVSSKNKNIKKPDRSLKSYDQTKKKVRKHDSKHK